MEKNPSIYESAGRRNTHLKQEWKKSNPITITNISHLSDNQPQPSQSTTSSQQSTMGFKHQEDRIMVTCYENHDVKKVRKIHVPF
jgi:hypothetical protein